MMLDRVKPILSNSDFLGTVFVSVGILISSVFSYLLQLVLARSLSVEDFGTFNALLSLTYLVGVPAGVFGTSVVKTVSELMSRGDFKKLSALFWRLFVYSLAGGALITFFTAALRGLISTNLKVTDVNIILAFAVLLSLSFTSLLPISYFQGLLRYKAVALYFSIAGLLRFLIPVGMVLAGYRLIGVFNGMFVAGVLTLLASFLFLRKNLISFEKEDLSDNIKKIFYFGIPVMFANFGLTLLNNIDMILVKKYFDPVVTGYYAGTVTLGKILLFGVGAVSTIMFPQIAAIYTRGEDYFPKFRKFLFMQVALVLGGLTFYIMFPKLLTLTFFGQRFIHSVEYLPMFAVFICLYVLVNFLVLYSLAIERTKIFVMLIPGIILQYVLITLNHQSLYDVIKANTYSIGLVLISLLVYTARRTWKKS